MDSTKTYSILLPIAKAKLAGRVQGVVVQTSILHSSYKLEFNDFSLSIKLTVTALSVLSRKIDEELRELVFRAMKMARFYEPPSVKRVRKAQETARRKRKVARKQQSEE
ncbi:30S ribosomal protein S21 [Pseudolycoriella hygida]|uniref:30S ribosomal protein S21 n=1 Tax=Pseudolycoriella hygida TaxID=35572 RepID=A0A9Q0N8S6_9DIPT|nr:30S ribosomal protein S21 [Pseudolycoriella hygida]